MQPSHPPFLTGQTFSFIKNQLILKFNRIKFGLNDLVGKQMTRNRGGDENVPPPPFLMGGGGVPPYPWITASLNKPSYWSCVFRAIDEARALEGGALIPVLLDE